MPKSIWLTDEQYAQVAANAVACGYRVQIGRGGQMAVFVVRASGLAVQHGLSPDAATLTPAPTPSSKKSKRASRAKSARRG